tara:strand:- start:5311 stop:5502 length:192 start_codon:yes stop_codon:yes gene_type:complete
MGKTFRRGGNERGYYSPGKSLRDKRQKGTNRTSKWEESYDHTQPKGHNHPKKRATTEEWGGDL